MRASRSLGVTARRHRAGGRRRSAGACVEEAMSTRTVGEACESRTTWVGVDGEDLTTASTLANLMTDVGAVSDGAAGHGRAMRVDSRFSRGDAMAPTAKGERYVLRRRAAPRRRECQAASVRLLLVRAGAREAPRAKLTGCARPRGGL
jgi:hypothetical protein